MPASASWSRLEWPDARRRGRCSRRPGPGGPRGHPGPLQPRRCVAAAGRGARADAGPPAAGGRDRRLRGRGRGGRRAGRGARRTGPAVRPGRRGRRRRRGREREPCIGARGVVDGRVLRLGSATTGCSSTSSPTPRCTRPSWRCARPGASSSTSCRPDRTAPSTSTSWPTALDDRTRLVAITHMPTHVGTVTDVHAVGRVLADHDAVYALDVAQTLGQMPIDVDAIGCQVAFAPGRKFLRAPRGHRCALRRADPGRPARAAHPGARRGRRRWRLAVRPGRRSPALRHVRGRPGGPARAGRLGPDRHRVRARHHRPAGPATAARTCSRCSSEVERCSSARSRCGRHRVVRARSTRTRRDPGPTRRPRA